MNKIEVKDLSYKIEGKTILDNISFTIESHSFNVLLGKNGSGKSTLMKFLSYILKSNSIFIDGKCISEYSSNERARKIAYISQNQNIDIEYSVFEYILMSRIPYGSIIKDYTKEDIDICLSYLKDMDMLDKKYQKVSTLSGGELQKVNIARALSQETDIILLDEPASALDISSSVEVMNYLKMINKKYNKTILLIVHDLNKAYNYSNTTILLKNGKILKYGKTKEILTKENIYECFDIDVKIIKKENKVYLVY